MMIHASAMSDIFLYLDHLLQRYCSSNQTLQTLPCFRKKTIKITKTLVEEAEGVHLT